MAPSLPARVHPRLAAAALALAGLASPAGAREILAGVPEVEARLDGTLRYNLGVRTDPVDEKIGRNPVFTGGEYRVEQWGVTTNRLDLLLELDLAWRGRLGVRVSGAGWYDDAYRDGTAGQGRAVSESGFSSTYVGRDYSSFTLDRYRGPSGELLDAFAFARLEAGGVPVTVKAGRHAVYWGESLMQAGAIHGIAYSQMPLDLAKGAATPGVEAKELFRPLAGVSAQAQLAPTLSLAGQVFLEWEPYLFSEGGTFLGGADSTFHGPDGFSPPTPVPPAFFVRNGGERTPREVGDFGFALRWAPDGLEGTLGLYYRRFTDKVGAVLITRNPDAPAGPNPALPSPFEYRQYFGEDVDLFGLSFARQLLGASVGAEVSFRHDQPLLAQTIGFAERPAAPNVPPAEILFPHGAPRLVGNSYQARGDTLHALLNAVGVVPRLGVFDTVGWAAEVTYSRWLDVRENEDMFFAEGFGVCRDDPALLGFARDEDDGCATRDHVAVGAGLTPTWLRPFGNVDLLVPMSATWTVHGNSPVMLGGNEGSGTWSAGIGADVANRWRFDLRYVDWFGRTEDDGTTVTSANGIFGILRSRGNVTFTAKATF
jgi:hypothetical protein